MEIKLFKKEINYKKKNFRFNPNLYWDIAVGCAFVLILVISFFSYNLFLKTNEEPVPSMDSIDAQIPKVSKDRILKVLDYFSQKEKKSTEILTSPVPVVDPSI